MIGNKSSTLQFWEKAISILLWRWPALSALNSQTTFLSFCKMAKSALSTFLTSGVSPGGYLIVALTLENFGKRG